MYSFRELQKASKMTAEGRENKLVILGNCATQFFRGGGRLRKAVRIKFECLGC